MADFAPIKLAQPVKVAGAILDGNETYYLAVDENQQASVKDAGAQEALASILDNQTNGTQVVQAISEQKSTYSAAISQLQLAASPTDFFVVRGSATKKVRITKLTISAVKQISGYLTIEAIRRSADNTAGTSANLDIVKHDGADAASGAQIRAYTANPSALGTSLGLIHSSYLFVPSQTSTSANNTINLISEFGKPIILDGTSDLLTLQFKLIDDVDDATDLLANITVTWSEE